MLYITFVLDDMFGIRFESGDGVISGVQYLCNDVGWVQKLHVDVFSILNNQSGGWFQYQQSIGWGSNVH
jgi:hypothetical protein